jgi:hypothetical protein
MDLDAQVKALIDGAPQDGQTPLLMGAIAQGLKHIAAQLNHLQYYLLQSPQQDWLITTLSNRVNPDQEKKVIYLFATLQDANDFHRTAGPNLLAMPVPVMQVLLQMLSLTMVDSLVFFDTPGNLQKGTEIPRSAIEQVMQAQLQQIRFTKTPPPDIA